MNTGKIFEEDFKKSVPSNFFYYRFIDGTSSWGGSSAARFQAKNICDCMVYTGSKLYLFELKSHKGKSLPFSCVRSNQIDGLLLARKSNIGCYIVVTFPEVEKTFMVDIQKFKDYMDTTTRKSIPINWLEENCITIKQTIKKIRYKYDLTILS